MKRALRAARQRRVGGTGPECTSGPREAVPSPFDAVARVQCRDCAAGPVASRRSSARSRVRRARSCAEPRRPPLPHAKQGNMQESDARTEGRESDAPDRVPESERREDGPAAPASVRARARRADLLAGTSDRGASTSSPTSSSVPRLPAPSRKRRRPRWGTAGGAGSKERARGGRARGAVLGGAAAARACSLRPVK
jgi:hypothetical protein